MAVSLPLSAYPNLAAGEAPTEELDELIPYQLLERIGAEEVATSSSLLDRVWNSIQYYYLGPLEFMKWQMDDERGGYLPIKRSLSSIAILS